MQTYLPYSCERVFCILWIWCTVSASMYINLRTGDHVVSEEFVNSIVLKG